MLASANTIVVISIKTHLFFLFKISKSLLGKKEKKIMLEKEFRDKALEFIEVLLKPYDKSSPGLHKMIWQYEHGFDFVYGQKTGMMLGTIFGYYIRQYNKSPPEDDLLEILEMIQLRREDIKNSIRKPD